jgi:hypothetical protein
MAAITLAAITSATTSGCPTLILSDEICIDFLLSVTCAWINAKNPRLSAGSCFNAFSALAHL